MKGFKEALKDKLSLTDGRINTIARSIINHLSYEFVYNEEGIYLEKDGKRIVVEQADRKCNIPWLRTWSAGQAKKIVDELLNDEEIIRTYRSAV